MYAWETALTNGIVRPFEWGFGWLKDFSPIALEASDAPVAEDDARMITINADSSPAPDGAIQIDYCLTAMAEISIFASPMSPATLTVARAGLGLGMSRL